MQVEPRGAARDSQPSGHAYVSFDALCERVQDALCFLGSALITDRRNCRLRERIASGQLDAEGLYRQLVCVIYRVLFLLVAEDRGLLHRPDVNKQTLELYRTHHSTQRLRALALAGRCPKDTDLWGRLTTVFAALAGTDEHPDLGLPRLGSYLWSTHAARDLLGPGQTGAGDTAFIENDELLGVIRALSVVDGAPDGIDYGEIGFGVLGSVYERLLGLLPEISADRGRFSLRASTRSRRKTTGSYYTPEKLVEHLLETALDPVIDERLKQCSDGRARERQSAALLSIRVCDPAVGSGHILLAAARRLAGRLACVRSGLAQPPEEQRNLALRDVIERCLYGVDIDPMAAELCRLSLWIEHATPGRALPVLSDRIKVGNALLGASPEGLRDGISDESFWVRGGGTRTLVSEYKRRNRRERRAVLDGHASCPGAEGLGPPGEGTHPHARLAADAWCAAFHWPVHDANEPGAVNGGDGQADAMTEATYRAIAADPDSVAPRTIREVTRLAETHRYFHWHLEFPEVFPCLPSDVPSGFDVVIGNPPFLNQLESGTVSERGSAAMLRVLTDGNVRGYADLSAAFLVRGVEWCRPGGYLALIQPQSLLATKDAGAVRAAVLRRASLTTLWASNERVFPGTSVYTCAPTIRIEGPRRGVLRRATASEIKILEPLAIDNDELARGETWAHLVAAASGIPEPDFKSSGCIGDLARATADFRDQYYGLDGFLVESQDAHAGLEPDRAFPPIVTSGLIDPASCLWGRTSARILKRVWRAPRVDRDRMEREGTLGSWIDSRLVPKVLLATQTRILEVFVDTRGRYLPSTPLISVMPKNPDDLWRIAAAISSPVCSAFAMQRYAGAALSVSAIKLSAAQAMRLPLPADRMAWERAAKDLAAAQAASKKADRLEHLLAFGRRMCDAFCVSSHQSNEVCEWWSDRLGALVHRRV